MKLYATTTSERASKGQGGNHELDIKILIDNQENPAFEIEVIRQQDSTLFRLWDNIANKVVYTVNYGIETTSKR